MTNAYATHELTWVFRCPVDSCRLYEAGFANESDANNALYDHLDVCHD